VYSHSPSNQTLLAVDTIAPPTINSTPNTTTPPINRNQTTTNPAPSHNQTTTGSRLSRNQTTNTLALSSGVKASKSGSTRPLQVPVAKNAVPVRHEPFVLSATVSSTLFPLDSESSRPRFAC
jgi:hypothetical protein